MITGQIPMTLTPSDVWQLLKDRWSVSEIAYMAGVSDEVAAGMVAEAMPALHVEHSSQQEAA